MADKKTTDATGRADDMITIPRRYFEQLREDAANWHAYKRTWLPEGMPFGGALPCLDFSGNWHVPSITTDSTGHKEGV